MLAAGIRHTPDSRRRIHAVIKEIVGEEHCPRLWKRLGWLLVREDSWERFVADLREHWRLQPATD